MGLFTRNVKIPELDEDIINLIQKDFFDEQVEGYYIDILSAIGDKPYDKILEDSCKYTVIRLVRLLYNIVDASDEDIINTPEYEMLLKAYTIGFCDALVIINMQMNRLENKNNGRG